MMKSLNFWKWYMLSILIPTCRSEVNNQIAEIKASLYNKDAEIVASCKHGSASFNRNWCLNNSKGSMIVMLDDDVTKFPMYWDKMLIDTFNVENIGIISPRLLKADGTYAHTSGDPLIYDGVVDSIGHGIPTACICFKRNHLRFDEGFVKSGFEDTDYLRQWRLAFPNDRFVINNFVKVVHLNNMVGQAAGWAHNKAHFLKKWPEAEDTWHD